MTNIFVNRTHNPRKSSRKNFVTSTLEKLSRSWSRPQILDSNLLSSFDVDLWTCRVTLRGPYSTEVYSRGRSVWTAHRWVLTDLPFGRWNLAYHQNYHANTKARNKQGREKSPNRARLNLAPSSFRRRRRLNSFEARIEWVSLRHMFDYPQPLIITINPLFLKLGNKDGDQQWRTFMMEADMSAK